MMAAKKPRTPGGAQRRVRISILWQILFAFVPLAVAAIAAVSYVGYRTASDSLREQALRQLRTVRENKQAEVERYLNGLEDQVLTLARNPSTAQAIKQLTAAVKELDIDPMTEAERLRPALDSVKQFLNTFYGKEVASQGASISTWLPQQRSAVWLQAQYIANNPNPPGRKLLLDSARDNSRYTSYHAVWHPVLMNTTVRFRFEDLYLIDAASARVVYSVAKNADFQATLSEGLYADSMLGKLFERLRTQAREGDFLLQDFAPYFVAHQRATAFAGTPLFEAGQKIGVLIVQLSLEELNGIMTTNAEWSRAGLGETGEAYLVGRRSSDLLMRSESRFLSDLAQSNDAVAAARTAVLTQKVETEGALLGPDEEEKVGRYLGYRGVPVFGAAAPLENLHGLDWLVIAEITEDEALQPVARLRNLTFTLAGGSIVAFLISALIVAASISRPLRALAGVVGEIQKGNYRARATVRSRNEIGVLAQGLNQALDERVDVLVKGDEENRRLQKEIRELLNVVAAASDGDFTQKAVVGSGTLGNLADALNLMFENVGVLIGHLRQATVRVVDAATQIRDSSDQLAQGAARQAADIAQTTGAVQDMSEKIQSVQNDAAVAAGAAKRTEEAAQQGGEVVKRVINGMDALQKNTRAAAVKIKRLGERSMEISTITNTIQKISAQTNMLALNAAIEASRAGEHGLGFSVVADEVRKLAEQTESATREITELIASIQAETNDAVGNIERQAQYVEEQTLMVLDAGSSLENVLETSVQSAHLIADISRATNEQASSARSVSEAMQSISEVAQQAQGVSGRTQQHAEGLFVVAKELDEQISLFRANEAPIADEEPGATNTAKGERPHPVTPGNGHAVTH
jgi:methyl-accepting chemotaxis protein